jgi:hypothetical protein
MIHPSPDAEWAVALAREAAAARFAPASFARHPRAFDPQRSTRRPCPEDKSGRVTPAAQPTVR